jgi:hypothetical protein
MKLSIAIAALFLAATTALPASAAAPTGRSFYQHEGRSFGLHHDQGPYARRAGADAYAAAPVMRRQARTNWGHCASGVPSESYSAYPSWDVCP